MPEQLSDAILLERFVSRREEAAFVALVERHGPLVQRICRRVFVTSTTSRTSFRRRFSSWREEQRGSRGANRWGAGSGPSPIGWRWAPGRT